jgi:DNA segregation ATPase FtsK/SpoIIIE, S-DNA-T family
MSSRPEPFDWERAEADLSGKKPANAPDQSADPPAPSPEVPRQRGPQDTSYEVAFDPEPGHGTAPVPAPQVADLPVMGAETRLPILPPALQSRAALRAAARFVVGRWLHIAGYHAVRTPWYLLSGSFYAARGVFRLAGRQLAWWWLVEAEALKQSAATDDERNDWHKLHREQKATRLWRGIVLAGEALAVGLGIVLLWALAPTWVWAGVLVVVGPILARYGRGDGRRITSTAVLTPRFRKLNYDVVLRAYEKAGLSNPDKPDGAVAFEAPGLQRDGNGSRVLVDLPYGKGFNDVLAKRDAIASGLDVALSQVFLSPDATSHRRHVLWVADRDPLAVPAGRTPLLRCRPTDIWQPAPFGLDERGQLVSVLLMWVSILVGAQPRQGKTFSARNLGLYAALDPYVKLTVLDPSGKPDWRRFSLVADRYAFGLAMTRDGDPVEIAIEALEEIKADVEDRYERLSKLSADVCPEGKLTREIARDPKYRMPVRVVILDEFQEYFDLGDASKRIASLLTYLVKVAPGAGVIFIDATQRPSGIGTGQVAQQFISFRDNHQVRFGLRTGSWQMSDLVLGSGAYSEGFDSSTLLPTYKGVGILRGAADATPTVRTYLADAEDAEKILLAARQLRERAGTLTGMAAGEDVTRTVRDVLADVAGLFGPGETGLPWQEIAVRLADRMPEHYAQVTAEAISAQLRGLDRTPIPSVDIKRHGRALKGAKVADIRAAITAREDT